MQHIDNNLYDRQIRTYGEDAIKKMSQSSILIMGLQGGLGTEIAKNLTLGGIRHIYLYDNSLVGDDPNDFETGIYYTKDHIGKCRSQVLVSKLQELNPYVNIQSVNTPFMNQQVTIVVNQNMSEIYKISKYSKLIVTNSKGVSGFVFTDAGNEHLVIDTTGENIEPVQIGEISFDGKVRCAPNTSHDFESGDFIKFDNLEGTNIDQFKNEFKIKVINKTTFQLLDFNPKPFNFINGTAIHIKKPITIKHERFDDQIINPKISFNNDMDYSKLLLKTYFQMFSICTDTILLTEQTRLFKYELIPVISLIGSFTASEAIKLVTNKFVPVDQFFVWYDKSLLPKESYEHLETKTIYGKIYGLDFENKLLNSKWFMVGSGAIGCEHLKNLAFMNVANSELGNGQIIITDPDTIEKSNLNRQFLFRSHHIGKSKSKTASCVIKEMKPNINIETYEQKVGPENIDFTNNIMDLKITGVLNALDNIKARRFMDELCFKYNLPLFESGTTGTKGNTQPVIPFVTETYSNSSDPEQEKSFPICTIKSFPNDITHTIHWAMDQFEFFNRAPLTVNKWITNPNILNELNPIEKNISLSDIHEFTIKHPIQKTGFKGCVEWAVDMFTENYYNSIVQLLHIYSPDYEITPGVKFWSAGKRCPKPIKFDYNNTDHFNYVKVTTNLLLNISNITYKFNDQELIDILKDYKIIEFIPKDIKIPSKDSDIDNTYNDNNIIIGNHSDFINSFIPQEFEKDNDLNYHIDWINASSNMRAQNYNIPIIDRQQTKGIAGRIIPAIATTTSAVSGLILLEMIKYLMGYNNVDNYSSTFINLAQPIVIPSEPMQAPLIEINNIKINSWIKFEYSVNSSLNEFKQYWENIFKVNITMIVIDTTIIYAEFIGSDSLTKLLSDIIREQFDNIPSNVSFTIACDNDQELPVINVKL
jgi:ubiquitin-activating enzyme E1